LIGFSGRATVITLQTFGNGGKPVSDRHMVLFGAWSELIQKPRCLPKTVASAQFSLQSSEFGRRVVRQQTRERRIRRSELGKTGEAAHAHPNARRIDSDTPEQGVNPAWAALMDRSI